MAEEHRSDLLVDDTVEALDLDRVGIGGRQLLQGGADPDALLGLRALTAGGVVECGAEDGCGDEDDRARAVALRVAGEVDLGTVRFRVPPGDLGGLTHDS